MTAPIDAAALGIPVQIEAGEPEIRDRLTLAWAALAGEPEDVQPLTARITRTSAGYRVEIDAHFDAAVATPELAIRTLNHELLQTLMRRRRDLFYVHAGVCELAGRAMVLPGLSRAGKSTLVLALLLAGARFLSDELLVWDPSTECAQAFPRAIKIRDPCADYFPSLAERFFGAGEARFLDPATCEVVSGFERIPVRWIVLPSWDPAGDDRPTPAPNSRTFLALTHAALNFGSHRGDGGSIDHLARILTGTAGHELTWSDPHEAARRLVALTAGETG